MWWLFRDRLLPEDTIIIGYARSHLNVNEVREHFEKYCKVRQDDEEQKAAFEKFVQRNTYISGKYDTDEGFESLNKAIEQTEDLYKSIYYHELY